MSDNKPVLTTEELLAYRRSIGALKEFPIPRAVIFVPQKSLASYIFRKYSTKRIHGFMGEFYLIKQSKGAIAFSTGFGIGAPVVAGLADEFSALGVKQFALVGMAGGLQPELTAGSLIISTCALRGEGVSRHYLPPAEIVASSTSMIEKMESFLSQKNYQFTSGLTWTTDAPFRELRKDVLTYQERGVLAVDMEAAGLLAVATANQLEAMVAFSVADTLANGVWQMAKDLKSAQVGLTILFDTVYSSLL